MKSKMQKEYMLGQPARDAAATAKMEADALTVIDDTPLHDDNEWNIR